MKVYSKDNCYDYFGIVDSEQAQYAEDMGNPVGSKVLPSKKALIDGYPVGDRVLEGVMFLLTVEDDGRLSIQTPTLSQDYMKTLNENHWLTKVLEFAEEHDVFDGMEGPLHPEINLVKKDGTHN